MCVWWGIYHFHSHSFLCAHSYIVHIKTCAHIPDTYVCRALARMGNVHLKQENWAEAVRWFDKSLAEHRNPDIVIKKTEVSTRGV